MKNMKSAHKCSEPQVSVSRLWTESSMRIRGAAIVRRVLLCIVPLYALLGPSQALLGSITELRLSPTNITGSGIIVKIQPEEKAARLLRVIVTPEAEPSWAHDLEGRLSVSDGSKIVVDCHVAHRVLARGSKDAPDGSAVFEFTVSTRYLATSKFHIMFVSNRAGIAFVWTLHLSDFVDPDREAPAKGESRWPNPKAVLDKLGAAARALKLTGFEALPGNITAERLPSPSADDQIPFLWEQYSDKPVWRVKFKGVGLNLKSPAVNVPDSYRDLRMFTVVIQADTGQLISVKSKFGGSAPDMRPEASASAQENALRANELYTGFPSEDPAVTLVQALDDLPTNARLAKEIDGSYVLETRLGKPPRPVWMLTLRGIPPFEPISGHPEGIYPWLLNRMRCAVDARTAKLLFWTNTPYPEESVN